MTDSPAVDVDAVLLVSFGGPEGPDDVLPFLRNVTQGRGVPDERLADVAEHYLLFGGVSPINAHNSDLLELLRKEAGGLPVYWGNRNWAPYLVDAVRAMRDDGVRRALAFVTSAYSSYSGCRQYREDIAAAVAAVDGAPQVDKLRLYFDHPGFVEPFVDATVEALASVPAGSRIVFTTHSVPVEQADRSGALDVPGGAYVAQHRAVARLVADRVDAELGRRHSWDLVYQSRSGPPGQPWLEPDVSDHLERIAAEGVPGVVLVPIGFVSDHMEVVFDLDTLARETADRLGLHMSRAATPGTDPRFVAMVVDLVRERSTPGGPPGAALSELGPWRDVCVAGCCPNPRGARPAISGSD